MFKLQAVKDSIDSWVQHAPISKIKRVFDDQPGDFYRLVVKLLALHTLQEINDIDLWDKHLSSLNEIEDEDAKQSCLPNEIEVKSEAFSVLEKISWIHFIPMANKPFNNKLITNQLLSKILSFLITNDNDSLSSQQERNIIEISENTKNYCLISKKFYQNCKNVEKFHRKEIHRLEKESPYVTLDWLRHKENQDKTMYDVRRFDGLWVQAPFFKIHRLFGTKTNANNNYVGSKNNNKGNNVTKTDFEEILQYCDTNTLSNDRGKNKTKIKQNSKYCHGIDWIAKLGTMTLNRMNYSNIDDRLQNGLSLNNTSLDVDGNVDDLQMSQIFKKFGETSFWDQTVDIRPKRCLMIDFKAMHFNECKTATATQTATATAPIKLNITITSPKRTSNGKMKVNKNASSSFKKKVTYKMDPDSHYRVYNLFKNDILIPQSGENKNNHNRRQSEIANEWRCGIIDWNYMFENYNPKWNQFPVLIDISKQYNEWTMNFAIKKNRRIHKQCEKCL